MKATALAPELWAMIVSYCGSPQTNVSLARTCNTLQQKMLLPYVAIQRVQSALDILDKRANLPRVQTGMAARELIYLQRGIEAPLLQACMPTLQGVAQSLTAEVTNTQDAEVGKKLHPLYLLATLLYWLPADQQRNVIERVRAQSAFYCLRATLVNVPIVDATLQELSPQRITANLEQFWRDSFNSYSPYVVDLRPERYTSWPCLELYSQSFIDASVLRAADVVAQKLEALYEADISINDRCSQIQDIGHYLAHISIFLPRLSPRQKSDVTTLALQLGTICEGTHANLTFSTVLTLWATHGDHALLNSYYHTEIRRIRGSNSADVESICDRFRLIILPHITDATMQQQVFDVVKQKCGASARHTFWRRELLTHLARQCADGLAREIEQFVHELKLRP